MALIVVTSTSMSDCVVFEVAFALATVVLSVILLLIVRFLAAGCAGICRDRFGSSFESFVGIFENCCGVLHREKLGSIDWVV